MINKFQMHLVMGFVFILFFLLSWDGVEHTFRSWSREEYSHGYLIPLVALYLMWQKRLHMLSEMKPGSLFGVLILFTACLLVFVGEFSSIYTIIEYAFWIGFWGIALIWVGSRSVKVIWAGIFYLVFMIPLPNFFYFNLSQELQLISSELGVAVIRFFDISVYLEGNVIDLGVYKLQVVEACNGLRYLFPLMSFGFLMAYIYKGPFWQRLLIFLSSIPITVLMNSFRIGLIGVTVEHFGIAAAEGVLHDFEGWIVFIACLGVMVFEIWIFTLFSPNKTQKFIDVFDLDFGYDNKIEKQQVGKKEPLSVKKTAWLALIVVMVFFAFSLSFKDRKDIVPDRKEFYEFPLSYQGWSGISRSLERDVLSELRLTDYFIADYIKGSGTPVNFYTAWYSEQRKGASIHSPRSCLPGGGWKVHDHTVIEIDSISRSGKPFKINRVDMQKGDSHQLVYYWFHGRDRNITNEYMAKWYLFWDSLTKNRTDGALVRLVTIVPEGNDISIADDRLKEFMADFMKALPEYIPD